VFTHLFQKCHIFLLNFMYDTYVTISLCHPYVSFVLKATLLTGPNEILRIAGELNVVSHIVTCKSIAK
jgi:hypothetical protein